MTGAGTETRNQAKARKELLSKAKDRIFRSLTTDCASCGNEVGDDQDSIECHNCGGWCHKECTGLNQKKFELLCENDASIRWACKTCVAEEQRKDPLDIKIDKLMLMIGQVNKRLDEMESGKTIKADLTKTIEDIVEAKLAKALDKKVDIQNRENNVVLFGIPETDVLEIEESQGPEYEKKEDQDFFDKLKILDKITEMKLGREVELIENFRLGKRGDDWRVKPRPIKLRLTSTEDRDALIKGAIRINKTLPRDSPKKVYINPDMTKEERLKQKELRDQLKARRQGGEENLIIRNGEIVKRRVQAQIPPAERRVQAQAQAPTQQED